MKEGNNIQAYRVSKLRFYYFVSNQFEFFFSHSQCLFGARFIFEFVLLLVEFLQAVCLFLVFALCVGKNKTILFYLCRFTVFLNLTKSMIISARNIPSK